MATVDINLTGQTYESRSRPLSAQVTRNFYPERIGDPAVKSQFVLNSFPGLKAWNTKSGADRGLHEHNGSLYHVSGQALYTIDSAGTETLQGSIPGSARCIMEGIGSSLVIVTDGRAWVWNGTTITEVTDTDLETPNSAAHLNNQMLYDGDQARFVSSDVGDPSAIDALNYATAESSADDLLRVYVFDQIVYLMGEKTIETWFNSGVGSPPFDRIEGGIMQVGISAVHGVGSNDRALYWLGNDRAVYVGEGSTAQNVSTVALSRAITGYAVVSDAIGWCFSWEGLQCFVLTFPTEGVTWVYPEQSAQWFEVSSGVNGGRWIGNSYAYAHGKHLVADYRNGNVYELDGDTYDENGATVVRLRDTGPIHGGLIGAPGKVIEMGSFEIIMETGVGLVSGQGSDPVVMLSFSDDGGRTFSTERWGRVGQLGQYQRRVMWSALGRFYERIIRIRTSDPVFYSIHSAVAELEVGI